MKTPGFEVKSPCGRAWFVAESAVVADYAEFLVEQDKLSIDEARAQALAENNVEQWFAEQFNWSDVRRHGTLIKHATPEDTERALNNFQHNDGADLASSFESVERESSATFEPTGKLADKPRMSPAYKYERNTCSCHPETCGCDRWKIVSPDGEKIATSYDTDRAKLLVAHLNRAAIPKAVPPNTLATDLQEFLYRVASQVPFEHAQWANERGAALLEQVKALIAPATVRKELDRLLGHVTRYVGIHSDGDMALLSEVRAALEAPTDDFDPAITPAPMSASFETWAQNHGGLPLAPAAGQMKTDDGLCLFPTYKFGRTEIAWRAWANNPANRLIYATESDRMRALFRCPADSDTLSEFALLPRTMTLDMHVAFAEVWFSKMRPIDDHDMQDAYDALLISAPAPPCPFHGDACTGTIRIDSPAGGDTP